MVIVKEQWFLVYKYVDHAHTHTQTKCDGDERCAKSLRTVCHVCSLALFLTSLEYFHPVVEVCLLHITVLWCSCFHSDVRFTESSPDVVETGLAHTLSQCSLKKIKN